MLTILVALMGLNTLFAQPSDDIVTGIITTNYSASTLKRVAWESTREQPLGYGYEDGKILGQRGVFLTAYSMASKTALNATLANVERLGGNTIIFDVKGNIVYFDTQSPLVHELQLEQGIYNLQDAVKKLHDRGFYAIARFDAISDRGITSVRPDTQLRDPYTGQRVGHGWIDPENPLALDYNSHVLCEVAASGIDEINLDYIRYSTEQAKELSVFSAEEKARRLETYIKMARETIDRCGPGTKLGLSTFAILGWDYKSNLRALGQDVVRFAPMVDVISPMAYPISFSESYDEKTGYQGSRTYTLVRRTLEGYQELLGEEHAWKLRPWLQGYSMTTNDLANQMRAVYDSGLCGFTMWNAGNKYELTYRAMQLRPAPKTCEAPAPQLSV